jgi:hypothetical protein
MKFIHKLILVPALVIAGCHFAHARTWTSVSGTTMEASLVKFDGAQVELETADGRRMRISLEKLSESDREYVQNLGRDDSHAPGTMESAVEQEKPVQPEAEATETFFGGATLAEPIPVDISTLPKVELRSPDSATYWAAQLGPRSEDVAYFIFDQPDIDSLHDVLYVYSPGSPQFVVPMKIEARRTKYKKSEDEEFRISRWSGIEFTVKNGPLNTRFNFEFSYGIQRPDIASLVLGVDLSGPAGVSRIVTGGYIIEEMATGIGEVTAIKILGPIRLAVTGVAKTTSNSIQANLTMQGRRIVPGRGMPDVIRVQLTDSDGKVRERLKLEMDESILLRISGGGLSQSLPDLKPLTTYTINATAGFGPVVGIITSEREFTTKEPKKKVKRK